MEQRLFSEHDPRVRLLWDAHALEQFMTNPVGFILFTNGGWRSPTSSASKVFGSVYHEARQALAVAESDEGKRTDEALERVLGGALRLAAEANLLEAPATKEQQTRITPDNLARSLVWYWKNPDTLHPDLVLVRDPETGAPQIEVAVAKQLPITTPWGEPYYLCGYLDTLYQSLSTGQVVIRELKTTAKSVNMWYTLNLTTSTQVLTYQWLQSRVLNPAMGIQASMSLDMTEVGVGFTRFHTNHVTTAELTLDAWLNAICAIIKMAESAAIAGNLDEESLYKGNSVWYPHGLSPFRVDTDEAPLRDIMMSPPPMRRGLVKQHYDHVGPWNPSIERDLALV